MEDDGSYNIEAKVANVSERLVFVMEMSVSLNPCQMCDGSLTSPRITSGPLNIRCSNLVLILP